MRGFVARLYHVKNKKDGAVRARLVWLLDCELAGEVVTCDEDGTMTGTVTMTGPCHRAAFVHRS